jgi:hypothetical protein
MFVRKTFSTFIVSSCLISLGMFSSSKAEALNWRYTADGFKDASEGSGVGTQIVPGYEIYGSAYAYDRDLSRFYFAVNSNIAPGGNPNTTALNGTVDQGDLFLNFTTDKNLPSAQGDSKLLAVRFAAANDSNAPTIGVYQGVTAKNVGPQNGGFSRLQSYYDRVISQGGTPQQGSLKPRYFNPWEQIPGVIDTYQNFVTDINVINDFSSLDLNFANNFSQTGAYTYGFSFDAKALEAFGIDGDNRFIASLFAECGNDGTGFKGALDPQTEVPEPNTILGTLVFVLSFLKFRSQNRTKIA